MEKLINVKVNYASGYGCYGGTEYFEGVEWDLFKKDIKTKRFDGSYKMNNGDLVEVITKIKG